MLVCQAKPLGCAIVDAIRVHGIGVLFHGPCRFTLALEASYRADP